jgi:hypothetical protein
MGAITTTDFTYYNGHRVTIFPEYQPTGPGCQCSKCGKAIDKTHAAAPVRVIAPSEPGEMRFHGQCYKVILEETDSELITSPNAGAQTTEP